MTEWKTEYRTSFRPATLEIEVDSPYAVWIGTAIRIEGDGVGDPSVYSPPWIVVNEAMGEERSHPVRSWRRDGKGLLGELWTDDGSVGPSFTVRPTVEADTCRSVTTAASPYPMSIPEIVLLHGDEGGCHEIQVGGVHRAGGSVHALLLAGDTGLYVRKHSRWKPVPEWSGQGMPDWDVALAGYEDRLGEALYVAEVEPWGVERYDEISARRSVRFDEIVDLT